MPAQDQLEIINAQGEVRFHDLNAGRGITNIGRHPDNDIVIESEVVAPFHAILDHQQRPFRLVALNANGQVKVSGQTLQPNVPKELRNWDTIELDGTSIILMEGGAATGSQAPTILPTPLPTPTPPLPAADAIPVAAAAIGAASLADPLADMDELDRLLAMLPEDQTDESIIVEPLAQTGALDPSHPNALDFSVEVEQPATMQIAITNGGDLVGEFQVEVRGIDPTWVSISPASINLFEGQRGNVSIAITAPRLASSTAKAHYFSVVVSSPNYPGRYSSTAGLMVIKPFYDYAVGDIDPKKQKIAWSKKVGTAILPITNLGNGPLPVQVSGEDERHAATIEFDSPEEGIKLANQVQFSVPSQQVQGVTVFITPRKRRIIGIGGENLQYTLTVTPLAGTEQTPRSVLGQASALPFMGPIPIILLVFLLGLLLVFFLTPRIEQYGADRTLIAAGESLTLNWRSSAFTTLKIEPGDGEPVDSPVGSLTVSPTEDTTYTLTAETILTALLPQFFLATREIAVEVEPVLPVIRVFETTGGESVTTGENVTVSWDVGNADTLIISINGADDSIADDQHTGTRTFRLDRDTIFTLRAFNPYTTAEGLTQSVTVRAVVPSATPPPQPLIRQFEITPLDIFFGEEVTITWAVDGASSVTITGVDGQLPPEGSVTVRPDTDTGYVLSATNGVTDLTSQVQQVIVRPPPTPTPAPNAPKIDSFAAQPDQVGIDSPESKNVQLSWSVDGTTTDIEIIGPSGLKYNGLPRQGSLRVVVDRASLYVLTAYNGASLFSSSTTQVKVINPVPRIDSVTPNSSIDVGGTGVNVTVIGSGFTRESKVQWAGSNRSTAYISPTQLTATILAEDFIAAGTFEVKVFNPTPGGGTSGAATFTLNNPSPVLDSISPSEVFFGTTDTTLNVFGNSFVKNSVVRFGGVDLTTTYVSTTQLSARIPASQLNTAGSKEVLVFNPTPGGGTSTTASFSVFSELLTPSIDNIVPIEAFAGSSSFQLTINGGNFTPNSQIQWKGINLATQFVSSTVLRATLDPDLMQSVGVAKVTVANPPPTGAETVLSQVTSNAKAFNIRGVLIDFVEFSSPTIVETIHPVVVNDSTISNGYITLRLSSPLNVATTIQLSTSNPTRLAVRLQGSCTDPGSIPSVVVPAGATLVQLCVRGLSTALPQPVVTARLPAALGGAQSSLTVPVNSTAPTINSLSPNSSGLDLPSFTMTIVGTSFGNDISKVKVKWGQAELTPNSVTSGQIQVSIPDTYLSIAGVVNLSVEVNGTPSVNTLPFTVGAPQLRSISPTTRVAGSSGFTLQLTGDDFAKNVRVAIWANAGCSIPPAAGTVTILTPSSISPTSLSVTVPATATSVEGSLCVSVVTNTNTYTSAQILTVTRLNTTLSLPTSVTRGGPDVVATLNFGNNQFVPRTILLTADPASEVVFLEATGTTTCSSNIVTSISTSPLLFGTSLARFCIRANFVSTALPASFSVVEVTADVSGVIENASGLPADGMMNVNRATATLTLTPSPVSGLVKVGDVATFTVRIATTSLLTPTVSNSITVLNGVVPLCTIAGVSSGIGSCQAAMTATGPLSLTAHYLGDSNFAPATSAVVPYTVARATTTIQISAGTPSGTSVYGQSVTFLARVDASPNAGNLNGVVEFYSDGGALPIASITATSAPGTSFTGILSYSDALPTDPNAGTHTITARYIDSGGTYDDSVTDVGLSHIITRASTTVSTPTASTSPSRYGQGITFSTVLNITSPGGGTATGTMIFRDGSMTIASVAVSATSGATITTPTISNLTVGTHSITAQFVDNVAPTNHNDSPQSSALTHMVQKADTTVSVVANTNSSRFGQPVTFTATVNITSPGGGTLGGNVIFRDGQTTACPPMGSDSGTTIATVAISGGSGTTVTTPAISNLSVGAHSITACYNDTSGNYNVSPVSSTVTQTVNKGDVTVTLSKSSPIGNPVTGETITFAATVVAASPAAGTPNGSVEVRDGATPLCTITLPATTCTASLDAKMTAYSLTANYLGNSNFNSGSSSPLSLTVNQAETALIINTHLPNPSVVNTAYTVTVTLSVNSPGSGTPTGTIDVNGGASGGTCTITLPTLSCSLTPTTTGSKTVTATYTGDIKFKTSDAPSVTHMVGP